ncbi:hypothetical protein GCM10012275_54390 [Longimycelium tulufanense]|uniref:Uncharacterized protein n=1 Tax=Longimycelium tulufanense TaxID=907463 RepID=A0A8J3CKI4_9PSEU|nr:hypothetical protein [Longimycelium tulufanense]GGM76850.1 hypothetical protein GCM10012275_54390 [Longimycelium tulufanense]
MTEQPPPGSVVITPDELFSRIDVVRDELREMRSDVRALSSEVRRLADLDNRVRALEQFRWRTVGAAAALGSIGGAGLISLLQAVVRI